MTKKRVQWSRKQEINKIRGLRVRKRSRFHDYDATTMKTPIRLSVDPDAIATKNEKSLEIFRHFLSPRSQFDTFLANFSFSVEPECNFRRRPPFWQTRSKASSRTFSVLSLPDWETKTWNISNTSFFNTWFFPIKIGILDSSHSVYRLNLYSSLCARDSRHSVRLDSSLLLLLDSFHHIFKKRITNLLYHRAFLQIIQRARIWTYDNLATKKFVETLENAQLQKRVILFMIIRFVFHSFAHPTMGTHSWWRPRLFVESCLELCPRLPESSELQLFVSSCGGSASVSSVFVLMACFSLPRLRKQRKERVIAVRTRQKRDAITIHVVQSPDRKRLKMVSFESESRDILCYYDIGLV